MTDVMCTERNARHQADRSLPPARRKMHFFNSFFYTKLHEGGYNYKNVSRYASFHMTPLSATFTYLIDGGRWSKKAKMDVTQMDYMFAPIHVGSNHW
jgi:Ulp1 family protease